MTYLETYHTDIKRLCIFHHVKSLYAFGSVVNKQFSDKSDVDFVVDFKPIALNNYADNYFDFKFSLQRILQRPIDLIEQTAIKNPYFEESVNKQRKLVYGL